MNTMLDVVGPMLLGLAAKATVMVLAGGAMAMVLRRGSAASKHMLWTATLAAVLALPVAAAVLPTIGMRILPASHAVSASPVLTVNAAPSAPVASPRSLTSAALRPVSSPDVGVEDAPLTGGGEATRAGAPRVLSLAGLVAALWSLGVAVFVLRLVIGTMGIRRLIRASTESEDARVLMRARALAQRLGVIRQVRIRFARRECIPVTWGVIAPTVLLPSQAASWTDERLDAVLLHELGHVARFDALTQMIAQLAVAVFWWNPVVWLAARQGRLERERACDDLVLAGGARASAYADDLLALVVSLEPPGQVAFAALAMARRSDLEGRLLAILEPVHNRRGITRASAVGAAVFWMALMPVALIQALTAATPAPRALPVSSARVATGDSKAAVPVPQAAVSASLTATGPSPAGSGTRQVVSVAPDSQAGIPPIRPLGPIVRVATDSVNYIAGIRVLSDGRVFVNDTRARRVILLDSTLAHFITVADMTGATGAAYGPAGGWLLPFGGDSSLYADFAAKSFRVIDPAGKLGRTMPAPLGLGQQLANLTSAAIDPRGNVVSEWTSLAVARIGGRGGLPPGITSTGHPQVMSDGQVAIVGISGGGAAGLTQPQDTSNGTMTIWSGANNTGRAMVVPRPPDPSKPPVILHDSTVILRQNIATMKVDTAVWLMSPPRATVGTIGPWGPRLSSMRNLFPTLDAWAMLPDGTIAVVRGSDYHVDWIAPNGAVTSTPKIAHEWLPLTDNMKRAIIDSVRRADSTNLERQRPRADSMALAAGHATCAAGNVASELVCSGSGPIDLPVYMTPEQLPNLSPPFLQYDARGLTYSSSPVRADADGNLWIRVNQGAGGQLAALPKAASGGFVYDIVSRQGVLVDRIQIPAGTTLIGFGRGVAYLVSREGAGYRLARARIH